ncbi:YihY/virulence factor BrkB family protein [uncultured Aeromicrobium sp.]|uniref:YihY/virulence factor BrkB family protein n=1 Tax=uncultured Aeromicrobium sp. TaxID=337820 RepID=UPI0025E835C4|nr:YihY/virulence factor BrkB family protein [uncultured Aeromicrobium sp.]
MIFGRNEKRHPSPQAPGRERRDAPDPEHDSKPDDITDISRPSWGYIIRKTVREFSKDECTDLAAALVYYAVLALFPALLALFSLVGLVGQGQSTAQTIIEVIEQLNPSAAEILTPTIEQLATSGGAGFALVTGLALALWSASGYVNAFSRAMNRIYEIGEGRPIWKLRPMMLLITLVALLLIAVAAVALVVSGPVAEAIGEALGVGSAAVTVWSIAKWPGVLIVVIVVVAILYYATPNVQQPKFRWLSVGAVVAIATWIVASVGFGLYVANFSNYNRTYGALAGVIVFLLWLWITNLALLFGAELDCELERGRQLQAGIAAEESVRLPPRDTRKIEKDEEKERAYVEQGRALRESRGGKDDERRR